MLSIIVRMQFGRLDNRLTRSIAEDRVTIVVRRVSGTFVPCALRMTCLSIITTESSSRIRMKSPKIPKQSKQLPESTQNL